MAGKDETGWGRMLYGPPESARPRDLTKVRRHLKEGALLVAIETAVLLWLDAFFICYALIFVTVIVTLVWYVYALKRDHRREGRLFRNGFTVDHWLLGEYLVPWRMVRSIDESRSGSSVSGGLYDELGVESGHPLKKLRFVGNGAASLTVPLSAEKSDTYYAAVLRRMESSQGSPTSLDDTDVRHELLLGQVKGLMQRQAPVEDQVEGGLMRVFACETLFTLLFTVLVVWFVVYLGLQVFLMFTDLEPPLITGVLWVLTLSIPVFAILMVTKTYSIWGLPGGSGSFLLVILVVGLLFVPAMGIVLTTNPRDLNSELEPSTMTAPARTGLEPGAYESRLIDSEEVIAVRDGETLRLVDCQVRFSHVWGLDAGFWVGRGGRLELVNTTVTHVDPKFGLVFEVHGSALIERCTITSLNYTGYWSDGGGGLEIYSSDVVLLDTTIATPEVNGVMVARGEPRITNCTFFSCPDDAIEVIGGEPVIEGCSFTDCGWGISVIGARARVLNCTFRDNLNGLYVLWSEATILGCVFEENTDADVLTDITAEVTMRDNVFADGSGHVVTQRWWPRKVQLWGVSMSDQLPLLVCLVTLLPTLALVKRLGTLQRTGGKPFKGNADIT